MHIRKCLMFTALLLFMSIAFSGCDAIKGLLNPFAGKWKSGLFELDFESDSSFKFVIGSTISINLNGEYTYDDKKLVLRFDKGSEVTFSYEFSDDKRTLTIVPETDFEYIKTKLDFRKR